MKTSRFLNGVALLACTALGTPAQAQSGVADGRVSLPEGPGSLEGVGDNARVAPNFGSMSYEIPIDVPDGHEGVVPRLALTYGSSAGSGVAGIGWDLPLPFIERMTNLGLPSYDADDRFVANGGEQLVHVPPAPGRGAEGGGEADTGVYRARFENGFVRYTWRDVGDGTAGYWTAEWPNGTVGYFGADRNGRLVDSARAIGARGTFRYQLVEVVNPFGDAATYEYELMGNTPYLTRIAWGPASVTFEYEARPDLLSDARSGYNEIRDHRLSAVNVFSGNARLWRYPLAYEPVARSGGLSRLAGVQRLGLNDTPDPIALGFEYSKTLANDCGADCAQPYLVDMGELGIAVGTGTATLLDIDGDALPDIVDSVRDGQPHRFFMNRLGSDGTQGFDDPVDSAVGNQDTFDLDSGYTQPLDVNGDGFTDLVQSLTGGVLLNRGTGDWAEETVLGGDDLPDFGEDFGGEGGELAHIRFFDHDNDRKIDILRSRQGSTQIYRNEGAAGFREVPGVEAIGYGFADARLDLADMNGDGLMDPVLVRAGQVDYRLNLGGGRWTAWREIHDLPFTQDEIGFVELEDLNGDSIADLVLVVGSEVRFALNRNGTEFQAPQTLRMVQGGTPLPSRANKTVLFADMNGSGSDDVVWIDGYGHVQFLELFPVRPNLLSRITNGLGMVTEVTYTTTVRQAAADPEAWTHRLPFAMQVVETIDTYEQLNEQHDVTRYSYRSGYYDGVEKQFRGFARVEISGDGDATQDASWTTNEYEVGADDPYRHGLLLSSQIAGGEARTPLRLTRNTYADCPVGGVPAQGVVPAVRRVCLTGTSELRQEGAPEAEWAETFTEMSWDGYGNVTREVKHGVVGIGGQGCGACDREAGAFGAPCGEECTGDEMYTETSFAPPTTLWMLNKPYRERSYASPGGDYRERMTYYDGPEYVGEAEGVLTEGKVSRLTERVDAGRVITTARFRHDTHGNIVEVIGPRGAPDQPGDRTRTTYDADGLLVVEEERELLDGAGQPYLLRRSRTWDPVQRLPATESNWITVAGGQAQSEPQLTRQRYDDLGRLVALALPGDELATPTLEKVYEYGAPVSRVLTRQRSRAGAAADIEVAECFDGLGRQLQTRTKRSEGGYEVTGYSVYNRRGQPVRLYRPFDGDTAECDLAPQADVPALSYVYDGLEREVLTVQPDADLYGEASTRRTEYGPLSLTTWDPEDTDLDGPFADTPTVETFDGLERPATTTYSLAAGQPGVVFRYTYDGYGHLRSLTDPAGNERSQVWDAKGRVVRVEDPDRGALLFQHDDADAVTRREDAAGRVVRTAWDALDRVIARWDEADPEGTRVTLSYDDARACPAGRCTHAAGQLVAVASPAPGGAVEAHYGYDNRQQLVRAVHTFEGVALETTMERDNAGRQTAEVLPDGTRLEFEHDAMGRVTAVEGFIDSVTYLRGALPSEIRLHNGTRTVLGYDSLDRADERRVLGPDGTAWVDLAYGWSRGGLLTGRTDLTPEAMGPGLGAEYGFDALYRLTGATLDPGRAAEERLSFGYDAAQNLISRTSSVDGSPLNLGPLAYGDGAGPHAVTSAGDLDLTYDEAGYLSTRGERALDWDYQGRLLAVREGESVVAQFTYGPGDDRVITRSGAGGFTWHVAPDFEIEDGMALVHVALGNALYATRESDALAARVLSDLAPARLEGEALEVEADGAITAGDALIAERVTTEGAELAEPRAVSATRALLRAAARRTLLDGAPRTTYLHHDEYANVVATSDEAGALQERHHYDPFGLSRDVRLSTTSYGYAGKREEAETGLQSFGQRFYDPQLGRWTAPDQVFDTLGGAEAAQRPWEAVASYLYVNNNPVVFRDDSGGLTWWIFGGRGDKSAAEQQVDRLVLNAGRARRLDAAGTNVASLDAEQQQEYMEGKAQLGLNEPLDQGAADKGAGLFCAVSALAVKHEKLEAHAKVAEKHGNHATRAQAQVLRGKKQDVFSVLNRLTPRDKATGKAKTDASKYPGMKVRGEQKSGQKSRYFRVFGRGFQVKAAPPKSTSQAARPK